MFFGVDAGNALTPTDFLRGSSINIGTTQRRLAWPLRKDDTHTSRSVNSFLKPDDDETAMVCDLDDRLAGVYDLLCAGAKMQDASEPRVLVACPSMCYIYIYIYIYIYVCVYIYIYIYVWRERERER